MAHMDHHHDEMLDRAATALHCKDWFYYFYYLSYIFFIYFMRINS